jgi:regulator of sigma E protease
MGMFYIILALLGFGILIFIHELAHFVAARMAKMKVEVFSIGFGKPIYKWTRKKVKWQICFIPFGGYVKIAGMQEEKGVDPYSMNDGFFGKKPWMRIMVALAGPLANVVFAFLLFIIIWLSGGSEKTFSEVTKKIGWIEPSSVLYQQNIRPGDELISYADHPFNNFKDILFAGVKQDKTTSVSGYRINYYSHTKEPFAYKLENYRNENYFNGDISSIGIMAPASYLIYGDNFFRNNVKYELPENSPMKKSGILAGDRIIWADGELIFSLQQLSNLINTSYAFLTVERHGKLFQTRLEKVRLQDVKLDAVSKFELDDWRHEAKVKKSLEDLFILPYLFNKEGVIESSLESIEDISIFSDRQSFIKKPLQVNDRIIAIDGKRIFGGVEILKSLQKRHVLMIVKRGEVYSDISFNDADKLFDANLEINNLDKIIASIGQRQVVNGMGDLCLLNPIMPMKTSVIFPDLIQDKTKDSDKLVLGIALQDRPVKYNPNPFVLFNDTCNSIWRTLGSLTTGHLNPKWLSGPIGVVQVMQYSWMVSVKEALFWLALISLNLGILNLLPIPVLDGGHILFSFIEIFTKKKLKIKTMERLIIPFVILLIFFFIYVTYYDLARLFDHYKDHLPQFLQKLFVK